MSSVELRRLLSRARSLAGQTGSNGRALADDKGFVEKWARLEIDCMAMETSEQRVLAELNAGNSPGSVSSLDNKTYWSMAMLPQSTANVAQMADSLARIKQQPKEVWLVKLADRSANLGKPPHYWSAEKILAYRQEA